jgi:hypothetical protein
MEVSVNEEPIIDIGKDTADYIDGHIVEAMVEVAKNEITLEDVFNDEKKKSLKKFIDKHKQETLEEVRKVERTELFNSIFSVIKQIPRKDVDGDAMDAPSCAYEIEQLFYKWQQEQDKNKYSEEELHNAFYNGWIYRGEDYSFPKAKKEWFEKFKKK